jgi:hypothetical protein
MKKVIRLTEDDLKKIIKRVIEEEYDENENHSLLTEQNSDSSCLVKSGLKKEQIGGPMTKRTVYSTVINGLNYQYDLSGNVRIFGNNSNTEQVGKWTCDSKSPNGIKITNLKTQRMNIF